MLRFLGFGLTEQEKSKKDTKPVSSWIKHQTAEGRSTYKKSISSETLLAKAKRTPAPSSIPTLPSNPESDKKETDVGGQILTSAKVIFASNSLAVNGDLKSFLECLEQKIAFLDTLIKEWKSKKIQLMGDCEPDALSLDKDFKGEDTKLGNMSSTIFTKAKQLVEPAYIEIHELLMGILPHIQLLSRRIESLSKELENSQLNATQKSKQCLELCDCSLDILTELRAFYQSILDEIAYCLKAESIEEKVINLVANLAFLLVVHRTLESIGITISFEDYYTKYLNQSLKEDKIEIDIFETNAEGHLSCAMHSILRHEAELRTTANAIPKAGASCNTLFKQTNGQKALQVVGSTPAPTVPLTM